MYPKDFGGLMTGYMADILFLKNTVIGDLFSDVFMQSAKDFKLVNIEESIQYT